VGPLAPILLGDISPRLRYCRPQGRELLLVLELLRLRTRLERSRELMLDHLRGLRVRLLVLACLLLICYLLLYILILESTLSSVVGATSGGLLLVERLGGGSQLASIVGRLSEMEGLSDGALRDMIGRGHLLAATVFGPVVGASFPPGRLPGRLCSVCSQACQE
jgi:hypothetical protein